MAVPKYRVVVDFDKDGVFFDPACQNVVDDDVTSDVRATSVFGYKIHRGVNIRKHRAEASVLELFLNNEDHKYSPFYPCSPLNDPCTNTSVFPAPDIWFMAGYPVDAFTDCACTLLANHTITHDDNFTWEGDTDSFKIVDVNKLAPTTQANLTAVVDFGESDGFVGVTYQRGSNDGGLVIRWTDADNYLLVNPSASTLHISKIESGTMTDIASESFSWTNLESKYISVEMHGDTIRASVNNTLVVTATTSFNNTATKHGVGGRDAKTAMAWNDFGGWRSLFFGRIDTIQPRTELHNQYAYIRAFDDMERQNIYQVFTVAPTAPVTAGDLVGKILDEVEFDDCNRIIDCGTTLTHNAQHRKSMGRAGLTELYQVQCDDVGLYYVDGAGYARYEDSCHRSTAPHTVSKATWRSSRVTGTECDKYIGQRFEWNDGKENVENEVWYFYNKISEVSCGVEVWRLNDTSAILDDRPALNAGDTFSTLAIGCGDVVACPITPVRTTDFTVNTNKCGTGCDLTCSVCAAIECGFEGNFRLVSLTNNSCQDGFVTFLRLRATKHTASARAGARAENTQSQTDNGHRRIQHCSLHIDEFDTAKDRADRRVTLRARPKERVLTVMENGTKANLMQMLHRSISDRIDVVLCDICITNSFTIEGMTYTGREGGQYMSVDWELQEAHGGGWGFIRYAAAVGCEGAGHYA